MISRRTCLLSLVSCLNKAHLPWKLDGVACWSQTLPNETPPVGKIRPFLQNCCNFWTSDAIFKSVRMTNVQNLCNRVYFMTGCIISYRLGLKPGEEEEHSLNGSPWLCPGLLINFLHAWIPVWKQAKWAGCKRRPFPMQLHQKGKSTNSAKSKQNFLTNDAILISSEI